MRGERCALAIAIASGACIKENALYCEADTDCQTYQYCHVGLSTCTPKQDGSASDRRGKDPAGDPPRFDGPTGVPEATDMPVEPPPDASPDSPADPRPEVDAKDIAEAKDVPDGADGDGASSDADDAPPG